MVVKKIVKCEFGCAKDAKNNTVSNKVTSHIMLYI